MTRVGFGFCVKRCTMGEITSFLRFGSRVIGHHHHGRKLDTTRFSLQQRRSINFLFIFPVNSRWTEFRNTEFISRIANPLYNTSVLGVKCLNACLNVGVLWLRVGLRSSGRQECAEWRHRRLVSEIFKPVIFREFAKHRNNCLLEKSTCESNLNSPGRLVISNFVSGIISFDLTTELQGSWKL